MPSCLLCGLKHISQALIRWMESRQGYPLHTWVAAGHMAEAADELLDKYPRVAGAIREERILLMQDPRKYKPRLWIILRWLDRIHRREIAHEQSE